MVVTFFVLFLLAGFIVSNEEIIEYPSVHYQAVVQNRIEADNQLEVFAIYSGGDAELYGTVFSVDMGAGGTITNSQLLSGELYSFNGICLRNLSHTARQ